MYASCILLLLLRGITSQPLRTEPSIRHTIPLQEKNEEPSMKAPSHIAHKSNSIFSNTNDSDRVLVQDQAHRRDDTDKDIAEKPDDKKRTPDQSADAAIIAQLDPASLIGEARKGAEGSESIAAITPEETGKSDNTRAADNNSADSGDAGDDDDDDNVNADDDNRGGSENDLLNPTEEEDQENICSSATLCASCTDATEALTSELKMCWWDGDTCKLDDRKSHDGEKMCASNDTDESKSTPTQSEETPKASPVSPPDAKVAPSESKPAPTPAVEPTHSEPEPVPAPIEPKPIYIPTVPVEPQPAPAPIEPESAPVEEPIPVPAPTEPAPAPEPAPPVLPPSSPSDQQSYDDDAYKENALQELLDASGGTVGMGLLVLIVLCVVARRLCCGSGRAMYSASPVHRGTYQGLYVLPSCHDESCLLFSHVISNTCTRYHLCRSSADEDDEWGWGDEEDNVKFSPPKSTMELPIRNAYEPQPGKLHESPVEQPKPKVRGMTLKAGVKAQPLTQRPSLASRARQPSVSSPSPAPMVSRPRPDDFFVEMGLASNPISQSTSSRLVGKSLGATPLPSGTSDIGEDDNWNDDDLDDLLND
jgi:hypothetical protein